MSEIEDTEFGRELIASMQEAVAIVRGAKDSARVHLPSGEIDVARTPGAPGSHAARFCENDLGWQSQRCETGSKVYAGPTRPRVCFCWSFHAARRRLPRW